MKQKELGLYNLEERRLKRDLVTPQIPERKLQPGGGQPLLGNRRHDKRKWLPVVPGGDLV